METVMLLAMVILLGVLYKAPAACAAGLIYRDKQFVVDKHHALVGHTIVSRVGISPIRCALLCMGHSHCLSFNHDDTSGSCQINNATKEDFPESFQQVDGTSFFACLVDAQQTTNSQEATTTALETTTASVVAHSFTTEPSDPPTYTFILEPMTMPFRLNFEVRTARDALVALAENTTTGSIFADTTIGGFDTTKSAIRSCFPIICPNLLGGTAEHTEAGLLSDTESRPFWIEYKEGVVTVGKGGQEEAFLEWDAGAYHGRVLSQVEVGISSWRVDPDYWIFYI